MSQLTWVAIHIHVFVASEGEAKAGRYCRCPLAYNHLRGFLMQPFPVAIIDVHHSLLVLSSKGTANGDI